HLAPRPRVDHRLFALPAGPLLALVRDDGNRAELDPVDRAPRPVVALDDLHPVEAGAVEGLEEQVLAERARDAPAPQLRVALQLLGNILVADDVADGDAAATAYYAKDLVEELDLVFGADEIEDAVREHDVDRFVGDERLLGAQGRARGLELAQV